MAPMLSHAESVLIGACNPLDQPFFILFSPFFFLTRYLHGVYRSTMWTVARHRLNSIARYTGHHVPSISASRVLTSSAIYVLNVLPGSLYLAGQLVARIERARDPTALTRRTARGATADANAVRATAPQAPPPPPQDFLFFQFVDRSQSWEECAFLLQRVPCCCDPRLCVFGVAFGICPNAIE